MRDHSIKPVKQRAVPLGSLRKVAANTVKTGNLCRRCRQMARRAFAKCYPGIIGTARRRGGQSRWFVALVVALADLASGGAYRRER